MNLHQTTAKIPKIWSRVNRGSARSTETLHSSTVPFSPDTFSSPKEGYENLRILKQAERLGLKQDQLDEFINAHPHYFESQEKAFNESHIGELLGPDPIADSRILRDMERFFGL